MEPQLDLDLFHEHFFYYTHDSDDEPISWQVWLDADNKTEADIKQLERQILNEISKLRETGSNDTGSFGQKSLTLPHELRILPRKHPRGMDQAFIFLHGTWTDRHVLRKLADMDGVLYTFDEAKVMDC